MRGAGVEGQSSGKGQPYLRRSLRTQMFDERSELAVQDSVSLARSEARRSCAIEDAIRMGCQPSALAVPLNSPGFQYSKEVLLLVDSPRTTNLYNTIQPKKEEISPVIHPQKMQECKSTSMPTAGVCGEVSFAVPRLLEAEHDRSTDGDCGAEGKPGIQGNTDCGAVGRVDGVTGAGSGVGGSVGGDRERRSGRGRDGECATALRGGADYGCDTRRSDSARRRSNLIHSTLR